MFEKTCLNCGKTFITKYQDQKFCSTDCMYIDRRFDNIYVCLNCGKEYHPTHSTQKYCSLSCSYLYAKKDYIKKRIKVVD